MARYGREYGGNEPGGHRGRPGRYEAPADLAVDFADTDREIRVEQAIERISEPAGPAGGRRRATGG
jgi:hypothetical protein